MDWGKPKSQQKEILKAYSHIIDLTLIQEALFLLL
jgi:hypothetical protein